MPSNIPKPNETLVNCFSRWLLTAYLLLALIFPYPLLAQAATTTTTASPSSSRTNLQLFPPAPADLNALNNDELYEYAVSLMNQLDFMMSSKTSRIILNSYDRQILNQYVDKMTGDNQVTSQYSQSDQNIINGYLDLANKGKSIDELKKYLDENKDKLQNPSLVASFILAINNLEAAKNMESGEAKKNTLDKTKDQIASPNDPKNLPGDEGLPALDRRTVEYLTYLVTPTNLGGAGHEQIKVGGIWRNYNHRDEEKNISKETESAQNISAHALGKADDIETIDTVKCSKWSYSRLFGIKVKKKNPVPIKVSYQTDQGVAKEPAPFGNSFDDMFRLTVYDSLLSAFSDSDMFSGDDEEIENLQGASLDDLLTLAGQQILKDALVDPKKALTSDNISGTIEKVGRLVIADELALPREAVLNAGTNDLKQSVGRYIVEQRIGLLKDSLANGDKSAELLVNTGERHIENMFELPTGSLKKGLGGSEDNFSIIIGQNKISAKLGISADKLKGAKKSDWEKAVGKTQFDLIFSQPEFIDEMLGLEYGKTRKFLQNDKDAEKYKKLVGENEIEDRIAGYQNDDKGENSRNEAFGFPTKKFLLSTGDFQEGNADLFKRMLNGESEILLPLGTYLASVAATDDDKYTAVIFKYLLEPIALPLAPDIETAINDKTALVSDEFAKIFKLNAGLAVFEKYGEQAIIDGIESNPQVQKVEDKVLNDLKAKNPELWGTIEYRIDKVNEAKGVVNDMKGHAADIQKITSDSTTKNIVDEMKAEIDKMGKSPTLSALLKGGEKLLVLNAQLETALNDASGDNRLKTDVEHLRNDADKLYQLAHEIISGEPYKTSEDASNSKDKKKTGFKITSQELIELIEIIQIKDAKEREQRLTDLALRVGSRQLDEQLDLPANTFYYIYTNKVSTENEFFQAVGQAKFEEYFDKRIEGEITSEKREKCLRDVQACRDNASLELGNCEMEFETGGAACEEFVKKTAACDKQQNKCPPANNNSSNAQQIIKSAGQSSGTVDYHLYLDSGETDKLMKDEILQEDYFAKVGKNTLLRQTVNRLTDDINIAGITITAADIWDILNGNGKYVFARMGGLMLDEQLGLAPGSGEKLISAQNSDERLMAAANIGGAYLFDKFGVNPFLLDDNVSSKLAQEKIEKYFGFPKNSFSPADYLYNLPIYPYDPSTPNDGKIHWVDFAKAFSVPIANENLSAYNKEIAKGSKADRQVIIKAEQEAQTNLDELNYNTNNKALVWMTPKYEKMRERATEIDDYFKLPTDTTINLLVQKISPKTYLQETANSLVKNQLVDIDKIIDQAIPDDDDKDLRAKTKFAYHGVFEVWQNKDENGIRNTDKSLKDWSVKDRTQFYDSLAYIFELNLDEKAGVEPDTFRNMAAHPEDARQIATQAGIKKIDNDLNLDGKLVKAYGYYKTEKAKRQKKGQTEEEKKQCQQNAEAQYQTCLKDGGDQEACSVEKSVALYNCRQATVDHDATMANKRCDGLTDGAEKKKCKIESVAKEAAMNALRDELDKQIFELTGGHEHGGIRLSESHPEHLNALMNGDLRVLTYVGIAKMVAGLNSYEDENGNPQYLPKDYRVSYDDVWYTNHLTPTQEKEVSQTVSSVSTNNPTLGVNPGGLAEKYYPEDTTSVLNQPAELKLSTGDSYYDIKARKNKRDELLQNNRNKFTGKVFTIYAYHEDQNIPPDFGYAILYGNSDKKYDATLGYLENYLNNEQNWGLEQDTLVAVKNYINVSRDDKATAQEKETAWNNLVSKGVFNKIENELQKNKTLAALLPSGSLEAWLTASKTGEYGQVKDIYEGEAANYIFHFADEKFHMPVGTSYQIYKNYSAISTTYSVYQAAISNLASLNNAILAARPDLIANSLKLGAITAEEAGTIAKNGEVAQKALDPATKSADAAKAAYAQAIVAAVTFAVTAMFDEQIAKMEKSLGLVPGTGAMLVGMAIQYIAASLFPSMGLAAANPITIAIFILLNLVMTYKVEVWCTADGYYPEPKNKKKNPDPNSPLNVGSGIFDGIKPNHYQQGLKAAANAKIEDLIADTLEMPYYYNSEHYHLKTRQTTPDLMSAPNQILTFAQETAEKFWNTQKYQTIFGNSNPTESSDENIGIGFSPLIPDHVHISF